MNTTEGAPAPRVVEICGKCNLPTKEGHECTAALKRTMALLMEKIGVPAVCRGCAATIYMVTIKTGEKKPYDVYGSSHFLTCPTAEQFFRRRLK